MTIELIIGWLILGLIGSRLEYLYLKAAWTEEYHKREFKREHIIMTLFTSIAGISNLAAGIFLYCIKHKGAKIR